MKPRIRVIDNRIEFLNSGAPAKSNVSFIREEISFPRNPILAKLFRSVRLAENAGISFAKMIRGQLIYRGQAPVFHQEIDFTLVAFWFTTEVDQLTNIFTDSSKKGGVYGSLKTSEKTGKKIVLSKMQREIVAILTEDYGRSFSEIARY